MQKPFPTEASEQPRTLRKAVTTLAIASQTESLTRTGRLAYNVMIYKAQNQDADAEGGYSAPLSEIIKDFDSTTRNSTRVRSYIEQMCTTLVRWFPLAQSDAEGQASLEGIPPSDPTADGRVFTLMSEARFERRSGEQWVQWFYPPSIRDMIVEPRRWAQLDIQEMSQLSHYAGLALFEIIGRYRDVPGGLSNRAPPAFWVQVLRPDPERTKPREWRKFKNETLKPAITEINQRTTLDVEIIEERRGRTVDWVQFKVRRREMARNVSPVDLSLAERAHTLHIKERDLDQLIEEYGEPKVEHLIGVMERRAKAQPASPPIKSSIAYLKKSLRDTAPDLFEPTPKTVETPPRPLVRPPIHATTSERPEWLEERNRQIKDAVEKMTEAELELYAPAALQLATQRNVITTAVQKRFADKKYQMPMIAHFIRQAYAIATFGPEWDKQELATIV